MADNLADLFAKIGMSETAIKDTLTNNKLSGNLAATIKAAGFEHQEADKATGQLVYTLATTITPAALPHMNYLATAVHNKKLDTKDRVAAAIKFVENKKDIDTAAFETECGVGVVVTKDNVKDIINAYTETVKDRLVKDRYKYANGLYFAGARQLPTLRWANGGDIKEAVDAKVLEVLGPKDDRDKIEPKKKEPKAPKVVEKKEDVPEKIPDMFFEGELSKLHVPGGNPQIKPELMAEHLKATGGKYITRFPPEPNGFLHIGHAKAININFGLARAHGGICNLRYDDTNPEAEEERYFTSILEIIEWLGFTPSAITYSSDHFQRLYDLAIELIKKDKAYICHCTGEEIQSHRGSAEKKQAFCTPCVHRDRPIEESLALFEKMKNGGFEEGEAILRMKMDLNSGNPQFWDLVAYRVLKTPHYRTGDKWVIYPTYDYTHCLVDSFENITHSLCTVEFTTARESYYWLCDALEVYKPVQWEYGRLNVSTTLLSKRKIAKLVKNKYVLDWDDPRLYTLPAIRRRGVPPEAINNFVATLGVTNANSQIPVSRLDSYIRSYLQDHVPRLMAALHPVKVIIDNLPVGYEEMVEVPFHKDIPAMGSRKVPFTREIWIDRCDFREEDSKDFFWLAPNKTIGLQNVSFPITCTSMVKDPSTGEVTEIHAKYENDGTLTKKIRNYMQWVAESPKHGSPIKLSEVRLFENLFTHDNPENKTEVPGGWESDINVDSMSVIKHSVVETGLWELMDRWAKTSKTKKDVEAIRFQLIRIGYFCVDRESDLGDFSKQKSLKDSTKSLVLNRTVDLKK